jgi:hypothetical protein
MGSFMSGIEEDSQVRLTQGNVTLSIGIFGERGFEVQYSDLTSIVEVSLVSSEGTVRM